MSNLKCLTHCKPRCRIKPYYLYPCCNVAQCCITQETSPCGCPISCDKSLRKSKKREPKFSDLFNGLSVEKTRERQTGLNKKPHKKNSPANTNERLATTKVRPTKNRSAGTTSAKKGICPKTGKPALDNCPGDACKEKLKEDKFTSKTPRATKTRDSWTKTDNISKTSAGTKTDVQPARSSSQPARPSLTLNFNYFGNNSSTTDNKASPPVHIETQIGQSTLVQSYVFDEQGMCSDTCPVNVENDVENNDKIYPVQSFPSERPGKWGRITNVSKRRSSTPSEPNIAVANTNEFCTCRSKIVQANVQKCRVCGRYKRLKSATVPNFGAKSGFQVKECPSTCDTDSGCR